MRKKENRDQWSSMEGRRMIDGWMATTMINCTIFCIESVTKEQKWRYGTPAANTRHNTKIGWAGMHVQKSVVCALNLRVKEHFFYNFVFAIISKHKMSCKKKELIIRHSFHLIYHCNSLFGFPFALPPIPPMFGIFNNKNVTVKIPI